MTVEQQILRAARLGWPRRVIAQHFGVVKATVDKVVDKARAQGACLPAATGFKWDGTMRYTIQPDQLGPVLERSLLLGQTPHELIEAAITAYVGARIVALSADDGEAA